MRQRLRHPTTLLAGALALLAVLLFGALIVSEGQRRDEVWVRHTLEVQNDLSRLLSTLQDAEAGQREYVLTGQPRFLEPYRRAAASIAGELEGLGAKIGDNAHQRGALARLRPLIQERLERLAVGSELRRTQGLAAAVEYLVDGRGKSIMGEIRAEIAGMNQREATLLAARQATAARTRTIQQGLLAVGAVAFLVLTSFIVLDSARQVGRMRRSRDELAAVNERLTAEVLGRERAEEQLRQAQKMEAVGQLTGGIAHDFNNMLSVVVGSLELARRRLRTDPDRAQHYIDSALEGAQNAAGLTARLLAFSRQAPLAPRPLDPNKLVGGMSELLRRTIGENVEVETVLAGGVWRVNVDRQLIENALLNLCVNARDAMSEGGNLTIETSNTSLDEDYASAQSEVTPGQYVLISVTDTGVGMPPEIIARAFDPFYTTKGVGRGTGLGLSQVFGFVKQSGGHIKIYSEVGRGTSVKIYLPRWTGEAAGDAAFAPATTEPPPRARDREIILLVEDDERVRGVTVDSLRELGYDVVQASSGDQALQQLAQQPRIDLLLTDIVMPGMTGRMLADQVLAQRPDLRVLYMTGYTRNAIVHNGVLDFGVAFLQKPFSAEQLARKVRDVLDGRGANR
ncbi:MAG: CHASE3 domain-containing protein [Phenylobacterium sp.]|uniref:CHASE3 domain-containing protein n=1 Tax=Phenylobacterium sp. TaxID=1871053 RepID=UPI001A5FA6E7|nr:CHASE3 domain-containing protein [Phenylobacterium sp.]MBL8555273.1 CHASE3 domain-containing protein [Phenylobacterium sp.]